MTTSFVANDIVITGKLGMTATITTIPIPNMAKQRSKGSDEIRFIALEPNSVHVSPIAATVPDAAPTAKSRPITLAPRLDWFRMKIGLMLRLALERNSVHVAPIAVTVPNEAHTAKIRPIALVPRLYRFRMKIGPMLRLYPIVRASISLSISTLVLLAASAIAAGSLKKPKYIRHTSEAEPSIITEGYTMNEIASIDNTTNRKVKYNCNHRSSILKLKHELCLVAIRSSLVHFLRVFLHRGNRFGHTNDCHAYYEWIDKIFITEVNNSMT